MADDVQGLADDVQDYSGLGFVGGTWDRADQLRGDPQRLADAFAGPGAREVLMAGLAPLVDGARLATAALSDGARVEDYVLLGLDAHGPLFLSLAQRDLPHGGAYTPTIWQLQSMLDPEELAHHAMARSLLDWHKRHGFCANCGHRTDPVRAGWSRKCGGCGAEHFPRVDPVVIMLAEHEGRVLVGRQPRFPARQYSALAGFVEPGETFEEAVARELWEEAGVRATSVRYVMGQPWPFPSSLMIACIAPVKSPELTIDTTELEDAIWVSRDDVRAALARRNDAPFLAPQPIAVAHHLLRAWLAESGG